MRERPLTTKEGECMNDWRWQQNHLLYSMRKTNGTPVGAMWLVILNKASVGVLTIGKPVVPTYTSSTPT